MPEESVGELVQTKESSESEARPERLPRTFGLKDCFTCLNLLGGVFAIIFCIYGNARYAAYAFLLGFFGDALDGLVARLTKTGNKFGQEFDSISDHLAQCVAPAFIVFISYRDIPMPAWVLGVLLVVMNLMGTLGGAGDAESHRVAFDVHLVGAAYGLFFFRTRWDFGTLWPSDWSSWLSQRRRRPRLKVHDPSEGSSALEKQADAVLEKLHQHGEASLTARERRILEDYSRRMKQKHR